MLRSRLVLEDCRRAMELADQAVTAQDVRLNWVAGISLVRAVGHVLLYVDSANDSAVAEANRRAFSRWSSDREGNAIYWDFICSERNSVLKRYQQNWQSDSAWLLADGEAFELDETLYCAIEGGRFAGADIRDMLQLAIDWWELQLDEISDATRSRVRY